MALKVPAVRFGQKGIIMYLTALPIKQLDYCSIDRWDSHRTGKWKGYQRGLIKKKINDLAEYLERQDGILPVAGLLNVREKNKLVFDKPKIKNPSAGTLTIPDYTQLWVVDMQHRLEGIKLAFSREFLRDFFVPVLITDGLSGVKEAAQFYLINTKSKRMGVDLTRRLLIEHNEIANLTDVKKWELKAVQIAILLNKKMSDNNPWYGRIREPEAERMKNTIASEKSFIPSLKWLLIAPGIQRKSAAHLARFLANYWEALRINMPSAFQNPRAYLIQKTPGYYAFHNLAPIIYRKTKKGRAAKKISRLLEVFSTSKTFGTSFWSAKNKNGARRYGTGQSAYTNLAMDLKKEINL